MYLFKERDKQIKYRDRFISCPDDRRYLESELTAKLISSLNLEEKGIFHLFWCPLEKRKLLYVFESDPSIALEKFVERLVYYLGYVHEFDKHNTRSDISIKYILAAIIYIDRIRAMTPGFKLTKTNIQRCLICGVFIASKILDDHHPRIGYFASIGNVTQSELITMERNFFKLCGNNVHLSPTLFYDEYAIKLMGRGRGVLKV